MVAEFQLVAFVTVAEERNFTRAAARLYLAQSGLSATIRSLERELNAPLFARTTRHVELTAVGAALLGEARATLAAARAAADAVSAVEGLRRGTLTLGIIQASALFDLPRLLARYRRAYPGIELRLQHASSEDLGRLLGEHRLDVIFRAGSGESSPDLVSIMLAHSPLVVVCSAESALADKSALDLRALADTALVGCPVGWGIRTLSDLAFRAKGIEPHYAVVGLPS
jgi:DNA-binding transcriptional LysR family regulator